MAYSTTTGISGLIERVTVGPSAVAWVGGQIEVKRKGRGGLDGE